MHVAHSTGTKTGDWHMYTAKTNHASYLISDVHTEGNAVPLCVI